MHSSPKISVRPSPSITMILQGLAQRQFFPGLSRVLRLAWTCDRGLGLRLMNCSYSTRQQGPLLSASQLQIANNSNKPPVVLDCTWFMPNVPRDAIAEFKKSRIPGARFFNLDEVSDK